MTSETDLLALTDWRRRIAELYAEVRRLSALDPAAAHATWRAERESLFRGHPASPVPPAERDGFRALHWPYRDAWRRDGRLEAADPDAPDGRPPAISFVPIAASAVHRRSSLPGTSRSPFPAARIASRSCA